MNGKRQKNKKLGRYISQIIDNSNWAVPFESTHVKFKPIPNIPTNLKVEWNGKSAIVNIQEAFPGSIFKKDRILRERFRLHVLDSLDNDNQRIIILAFKKLLDIIESIEQDIKTDTIKAVNNLYCKYAR